MTDEKTIDASKDTTETVDVWVAGTEEAQFQPTTEPDQEIGPDESEERLAEQFGSVVEDDYVFDDEVQDDERMIVNMGPQHPSTHGVLRLQNRIRRRDHPEDQADYRISPHWHGEDGGAAHFWPRPNQRHTYGLSGSVPL